MTHPQSQVVRRFEKVPDELLREIFMHIAMEYPRDAERSFVGQDFPVRGPHPLFPVVQVNKRFNAVASPLLVRQWHMVPFHENGARFVRHLLRYPHLRSQVEFLAAQSRTFDPALPEAEDPDITNTWPQTFISTAEVQRLAESAEQACPPLAALEYGNRGITWTDQIGKRSPDAISALVLAWATELQELDLSLVDYSEDSEFPGSWMMQLIKLAVGVLSLPEGQDDRSPPPMFQKLHSVTFEGSRFDEDTDGPVTAALFRLPSLRVFKAIGMYAAGLTLDEADTSGSGTALQPPADRLFPNGTSHVEEIYLYRSNVSENGLRVLTRACGCLRVLVLQWNNCYYDTGDLFGDAIADAINLHRASLEELSISRTELGAKGAWHEFKYSVDPEIWGLSLLLCDKLEHLTIDLKILYGDGEHCDEVLSRYPLSSILPPSLITCSLGLCFFEARELKALMANKDSILEFLRHCGPNGRFSRLRRLQLTGCISDLDANGDIGVMAKEAAVDIHIRPSIHCSGM